MKIFSQAAHRATQCMALKRIQAYFEHDFKVQVQFDLCQDSEDDLESHEFWDQVIRTNLEILKRSCDFRQNFKDQLKWGQISQSEYKRRIESLDYEVFNLADKLIRSDEKKGNYFNVLFTAICIYKVLVFGNYQIKH